jgi:tellurite resistance protein TerC
MLIPFAEYWWAYAAFTAFILVVLALDLGVFHRRAHVVSMLLRFGLAFVLLFVGLKMVWLNEAFGGKFPITWSLAIIVSLVGGAIAASLVRDWWHRRLQPGEDAAAKA